MFQKRKVLRLDPTRSERTKRGTKGRAWQIAIDYLHRNTCWKNGSRDEKTKMAGAELESGVHRNPEEYKWEIKYYSLGTGAQIPTGYMVKTLRAQSACDSIVPSNQMLSTF